MSVSNFQFRSIDGLDTIHCDVINVVSAIEVNGDNGDAGQLLASTGTGIQFSNLSDVLSNLTLSAPLSFLAGSEYNGTADRQITIADGDISNAKLENSTISGKALGTNLSTATFTGPLTATTYNGTADASITIADGDISNAKLENSTISGKALGTNLSTLTFTGPLTATTYNGVGTASVSIADYAISNAKLEQSTISGKALGTSLDSLSLYHGLEWYSGTNYNGSAGSILNAKIKVAGGITSDTDGLSLTSKTTTIGGTQLTLGSAQTDLDMDEGIVGNGDFLDGSNLMLNNRMSYEDTGVGASRWIYIINSGDWRPNDDSSYYNISIDDEINALTGRGRTMTSSLEAMAVLSIPTGWTPTGILVDVRDAYGNAEPETLAVYKVRNWGGVNYSPADIVGSTTNTERTFTSSYGVSTSQYSMLVKVHLNANTDYIGGGYVVLTKPTF